MDCETLKKMSLHLWILVLCCQMSALHSGLSHQGRVFFLCFLENRVLINHPVPRLFISSLADTRIIVSIRVPRNDDIQDIFLELQPRTAVIHELSSSIQTRASKVDDNGVLVEANGPITVEAASLNDLSTDSFIVFPMESLGQDYIIMSFMFNNASQNRQGPSQFAVVSMKDFTDIEITLPNDEIEIYRNNWDWKDRKVRMSLDFCQILQLQSYQDLTGTRIRSTYPVAVISGDVWVSVGAEYMGDHVVEMLPPTPSWGYEFLAAPIATRTGGDVFRVLAKTSNTMVKIYKHDIEANTTDFSMVLLQKSEFHEFNLESDQSLSMVSNHPVLVAQFCKSYSTDGIRQSDPFMAIIPPISQYLPGYSHSTPTTLHGLDEYTHYINIVAPTESTETLLLNQEEISSSMLTRVWTDIPKTNFSFTTVIVQTGYHRITSTTDSPFMAMVYGMKYQESYGNSLGQSMDKLEYRCFKTQMVWEDFFDNDCDGIFDEEIANGIDDDGDGIIDEDIFNEFNARSMGEEEEDEVDLEEIEDSMRDYYESQLEDGEILGADFINDFDAVPINSSDVLNVVTVIQETTQVSTTGRETSSEELTDVASTTVDGSTSKAVTTMTSKAVTTMSSTYMSSSVTFSTEFSTKETDPETEHPSTSRSTPTRMSTKMLIKSTTKPTQRMPTTLQVTSKLPTPPPKVSAIQKRSSENGETTPEPDQPQNLEQISVTTVPPEEADFEKDWTMFIIIPVCIIVGVPVLCCVCIFGKYIRCNQKEKEPPPKSKRKTRHNQIDPTPPNTVSSEIQPMVPFTNIRSRYEQTGVQPGPLVLPHKKHFGESPASYPSTKPLGQRKPSPYSISSKDSSGASSPSSNSTHSLVSSRAPRTKKPKGIVVA